MQIMCHETNNSANFASLQRPQISKRETPVTRRPPQWHSTNAPIATVLAPARPS
jgi:hypothetical protein